MNPADGIAANVLHGKGRGGDIGWLADARIWHVIVNSKALRAAA